MFWPIAVNVMVPLISRKSVPFTIEEIIYVVFTIGVLQQKMAYRQIRTVTVSMHHYRVHTNTKHLG